MKKKVLIISGPSCSGKSTIGRMLNELIHFRVVDALTTRKRRDDDFNYEYVNEDAFDKLDHDNKLMICSDYRNQKYGISFFNFKKVIKENKIPVLIITSKSALEFCEKFKEKYEIIWFFIDSTDEVLFERFQKRSKQNICRKEFEHQNQIDREHMYLSNYILKSNDNNLSDIVKLIQKLVFHYNKGGGLSKEIITLMLRCGMLLENFAESSIKGASYDLLLGDEYYYDGKIRNLNNSNSFLTIEPYDYAIVSCRESACIPRDVIGKFGLSVGLFCQGIILSNGPQIDPGFKGTLFCLLFNTSNRAVHLKRGMHYATIEFTKLLEQAPPYNGNYQGKTKIIEYIPANAMTGAINELKKEIENLKKESKTMQNIYLGVVALMFAIISILLVLK